MESFDPQMAQRVWQRVRATERPEDEAAQLPALIAEKQEQAATYLQLSRRFQGKDAAVLRRLSEEERSHAACLKGICTLLTGDPPTVHSPAPSREPTQALLRRCYGKELQCLARYEQWAAHREYGPVFTQLARQEQEHCRILLELLGNLKK